MKLLEALYAKCKTCDWDFSKTPKRDHRFGVCDKCAFPNKELKEAVKKGYLAYVVPEQAREELARRFPPKYPEFIGNHVTHIFPYNKEAPQGTSTIKVVGRAEEDGLEAFVVTVDGQTLRPDGKRYHITWSLDKAKGKKPVMSNDLIARSGSQPVETYQFEAPLELLPL